MSPRDNARRKRRAAHKLAQWRADWAPYPLGPRAAKRAKRARAQALDGARQALAHVHRAYAERRNRECPPIGDGGVCHPLRMRHLLDGGAALREILAPYRKQICVYGDHYDRVRALSWRAFYGCDSAPVRFW